MTDDDCDANSALLSAQTDAIRLDLSRFRHFGDEWQQICQTLLSCERLLAVMSDERHDISDDKHDAVDRQQLRQIIKSIEPKKYSKAFSHRRQSQTTRRSSYHRLKALTQLLMTSNLKVIAVTVVIGSHLSFLSSAPLLCNQCLSSPLLKP